MQEEIWAARPATKRKDPKYFVGVEYKREMSCQRSPEGKRKEIRKWLLLRGPHWGCRGFWQWEDEVHRRHPLRCDPK